MTDKNADMQRKLVVKRGQIKAQLTKFHNFVTECRDKWFELKIRKQKVELLWEEFQSIQVELELLGEPELTSESEYFETKYFEAIALADSKLSKVSLDAVDNRSATPSDSRYHVSAGIKLPDIKLPEFSGDYGRWTSFRESFVSLIDKNTNLTNVQKFFYLKSVLKDESLKIVNNLDVTEANYEIAWDLLVDRYENKKLIIHSHLKAIFELNSVAKESYESLRLFLDTFQLNFRALSSLHDNAQYWHTILLYLLNSKLDINTRREWENHTKDKVEPTIEMFVKFLSSKCQLLQTIDNKANVIKDKKHDYKPTAHVNVNFKSNKCVFCNGTHMIYFCDKFLEIPVNSRYDEVKKLNICTNCLKPGHTAIICRANACKKCNKKHNSLLHFVKQTLAVNKPDEEKMPKTEGEIINKNSSANSNILLQNTSTTLVSCVPKEAYVLLATAVVYVVNKQGEWIRCRALLDSASQSNFITKRLATQLQLKCFNIKIPVTSLNNTLNSISQKTTCTFHSLLNNFNFSSSFLVVDQITENLPQIKINVESLKIPAGIMLADPEFNIPGPIDLLIGANLFWDLLEEGQIKLGKDKPNLQKTCLGWLISGQMCNSSTSNILCNLNITNETLSKQLEKFWSSEEISSSEIINNDECEKHFVENYYKDQIGRFVVSLPFNESPELLGESKQQAKNRFLALENKFAKDKNLAIEYKKFMLEYEQLGHMKEIDTSKELLSLKNNYYLPHHCVIKNDSLTTRYRVVFDASAKSSSNISLNDILMVGPCIQDELFSIIIRFRLHNVVLVADISKMYRQIKVNEKEHKYQRIVWRANPDEDLKTYELQTLTYGTAPASFLATRCLKQIAIDNYDKYDLASEKIMHDFYMDDLLTGASDIQDAKKLKAQLEYILSSAGLILRKWISNKPDVLVNSSIADQLHYLITENDQTKTLGIIWDSVNDQFKFKFQNLNMDVSHVTKRLILSTIAKIFDPIGLLAPIVMKAKCFIQRLWQMQLDWDQSVPLDIKGKWLDFYKQLNSLNDLAIIRQITTKNAIDLQLHGFSDASEAGYGACIYLRVVDQSGLITSRLICAKSRVAPVKTVSLPRLELNGAVILARLMKVVLESLKITVSKINYWSDSTIVLQWISKPSSTWKVYVGHRVSKIQQISEISCWNHVVSAENPADIISRGCFPHQLHNNSLWWNGPSWLTQDYNFWPLPYCLTLSKDIPDLKTKKCINLTNLTNDTIFKRFSNYRKLIKTVAWMLRFIKNAKSPKNKRYNALSIDELQEAITILSRLAQLEFSAELNALQNKKRLSNKSKLLSLNPFVDKDNLLRVGGRLRHSNLPYEQKHPIILPKNHVFTKLIIRNEHLKNLHANAQLILSNIRLQFWILNGKQVVRSELRKCTICFRAKPVENYFQMGNLPSVRVNPSRIFSSVGIDFAGPFLVKDGRLRNRKLVKTYFCIFICMVSKAVHLEPVGDLSTDSFLNTLKRFVSRRGLCSRIFSDNATNLTGANNEMKRIIDLTSASNFQNYLMENKIEWHFIPARSPHFGGIWESGVRSTKYFLKRVAFNIHFTFEEFLTLLCQIEAILNSRPLIPLSNDPEERDVLTPGHFIIGTAMSALPQSNLQGKAISLVRRYELLQKTVQQFWTKWSKNYLNSLQQRSKWKHASNTGVELGSLVILKEDNVAPQQWPLGRITGLHPGSDGVVRVVTVKTSKSELKRALNRVCVLPIET